MPTKPSATGRGDQHDDGCRDQWGGEGVDPASMDRRGYIAITHQLHRHPKFRRMSMQARLHLLALWSQSSEFGMDGVVDRDMLYAEGDDVALELISVGWVHPMQNDALYYCHDYLKHQWSKAQIQEMRAGKARRGVAGAHKQWHVKRGVTDPDCPLCVDDP